MFTNVCRALVLGLFTLFSTFTFAVGTDPAKAKTDPPKAGMTVPLSWLEELSQNVARSASSITLLNSGILETSSIPITFGGDLKTEVTVQKRQDGTLQLVQIKTQTRNDGVVNNQTMFIYPEDQSKNYISGNNQQTPANNPFNVVLELNALFKHQASSPSNQSLEQAEPAESEPALTPAPGSQTSGSKTAPARQQSSTQPTSRPGTQKK